MNALAANEKPPGASSPYIWKPPSASSHISVTVDVDGGPVGPRQERVEHVRGRIERERVASRLGRNALHRTERVRVDHLDDSGIADRHVEVSPRRVEEDHVRDTT